MMKLLFKLWSVFAAGLAVVVGVISMLFLKPGDVRELMADLFTFLTGGNSK